MIPDPKLEAIEAAARRFVGACDAMQENGPMYSIVEAKRDALRDLTGLLSTAEDQPSDVQ